MISDLKLELPSNDLFHEQYYTSNDVKAVFITLKTGEYPSKFSHLCNNTSLKWNLAELHITTSNFHFSTPCVYMLFVRGEYVSETSLSSNAYRYLGVIGTKSVSSQRVGESYEYDDVTFVFDYSLSRKDLQLFGNNLMHCKKNKYGSSLCKSK